MNHISYPLQSALFLKCTSAPEKVWVWLTPAYNLSFHWCYCCYITGIISVCNPFFSRCNNANLRPRWWICPRLRCYCISFVSMRVALPRRRWTMMRLCLLLVTGCCPAVRGACVVTDSYVTWCMCYEHVTWSLVMWWLHCFSGVPWHVGKSGLWW